jgi:hypothetical protein
MAINSLINDQPDETPGGDIGTDESHTDKLVHTGACYREICVNYVSCVIFDGIDISGVDTQKLNVHL